MDIDLNKVDPFEHQIGLVKHMCDALPPPARAPLFKEYLRSAEHIRSQLLNALEALAEARQSASIKDASLPVPTASPSAPPTS